MVLNRVKPVVNNDAMLTDKPTGDTSYLEEISVV